VSDITVSQWEETVSINVFGQVLRPISREDKSILVSALSMDQWPISVSKVDFCDFLEQQPVAPHCPLARGDLNMTIHLRMPQKMPPSTYNLQSLVEDGNGNRVICLKGSFEIPGFA
jgi:hypothetical protein